MKKILLPSKTKITNLITSVKGSRKAIKKLWAELLTSHTGTKSKTGQN